MQLTNDVVFDDLLCEAPNAGQIELVVVPHCGDCGNGHQAALSGREIGRTPQG